MFVHSFPIVRRLSAIVAALFLTAGIAAAGGHGGGGGGGHGGGGGGGRGGGGGGGRGFEGRGFGGRGFEGRGFYGLGFGYGYGYGYGYPYGYDTGYYPDNSYNYYSAYPPYDDAPADNAYNVPPPSYTPPPAASIRSRPTLPPNAVLINVRVPASADVFFDGSKTSQTGIFRQFECPPLPPGEDFNYVVRAVWTDNNGQTVERTRKVTVRAGDQLTVNFLTPQK